MIFMFPIFSLKDCWKIIDQFLDDVVAQNISFIKVKRGKYKRSEVIESSTVCQ